MPVVECKLGVKPEAMEVIEGRIALLGDLRWTVWEDRLANRAWVSGYFESRSKAEAASRKLAVAIGPERMVGNAAWRKLADADWAESYKAHFKAWRIGRRFWVPDWERGIRRIRPGDEVVWLDPGMAFGTGNHESTRLCCQRLVEYLASGRRHFPGGGDRPMPLDGCCSLHGVIDAGCGSGILGISAARFGLSPVVGFDNDPIAVRVSRENALLNLVTGNVEFFEGDLSSGLSGRQAGLVFANILADVLRRSANELVGAVAPGGWLVLSGILAGEVDDLREDFLAAAAGRSERSDANRRTFRGSHRGDKARAPSEWKAVSRRLGNWADLVLIRGE